MQKDKTTSYYSEHFEIQLIHVQNNFVFSKISASPEFAGRRFETPEPHCATGFISSGSITFYCGLSEYKFEVGQPFLINENSIYDSFVYSNDFSAYYIIFNAQFIEYLCRITTLTPKQIYNSNSFCFFQNELEKPMQEYCLNRFKSLENLIKSHKQNEFLYNFVRFEISGYIQSVFLYSEYVDNNHKKDTSPTKPHFIYSRYLKLLNENKNYENKVGYYAKRLGITPKYLSVITKLIVNKTALEIRDEYLITKAKHLIKQSSLNLQEISEQLGFDSQSNFSRFFKKMEGMSPSEFKK